MEVLIKPEIMCSAVTQGQRWLKLAAFLFGCCFVWQTAVAAETQESRRVLVLYERGISYPAVALADHEIRAVLEKQSNYHIDLYIEYLETGLIRDPESEQKVGEWYLRKYGDRRPDVIIAVGGDAIQFIVNSHEKYFPGVPVVLSGSLEESIGDLKLGPGFTGVWMVLEPAKTLDAALQLQPDTKQVIVVNGASPFDKSIESLVRKDMEGYQNKLQFTYLSGLPMSDLMARLRQTPNHTIILYGAVSQDATGKVFINATQSLPMVVGVANAPVFTFLGDTLVGQGSVGGYVNSYAAQGRIAAEDVLRILGGEKPENIPFVNGTNLYLFDWRALKHRGLKESKLPAGSIVLNRQPTVWEAFGRYVALAVVLLFAQTLLILELLRQRKKERIIKAHLRESEARFREAQRIAQCGSWVWDIAKNKTYWSDEMYRILGLLPQSVAPAGSLMHGDMAQYYAAKMQEVVDKHQPYRAEHRIMRPDGEERIVVELGHAKYNSHQEPISMIGTLVDITEQRRSERVLRESEDRFRAMADGAPVMMWMSGLDKRCTDFNRSWLMFTGRTIEQELGDGWADGVHPDDLQRCLAIYADAFDKRQPFDMDYRLRRYDGEYRWITDSGSPRLSPDGTFAGYIGCCVDIHDRKAAELARRELAGRLMSAQEAERTRIARELHDGIGQEIALLSVQMQRAKASISLETGLSDSEIQKLGSKLAAIGHHVSLLSHQLHSSELEYLGLAIATTGLCREFSEQYGIKVECSCRNIPRELPNDVALALLRVTQEALHNIAKHSNAKLARVELASTAGELTLMVRDDGAGFDLQQTRTSSGLGLISMRERIYLIRGEFAIDSSPGAGTTIRVRVPLTGPNSSLPTHEASLI